MRFSPSTFGWYPEHIDYTSLPPDVVEVDDGLYLQLIGKQIEVGPSGQPREKVALPPTFEQRKDALLSAVDAHLNQAARARGYDDIRTAVTYAEEPAVPKFQAEGQAMRAWRSLVYAKCYEVLAAVQSGGMAEPTKEQLLALLPVLNLPE